MVVTSSFHLKSVADSYLWSSVNVLHASEEVDQSTKAYTIKTHILCYETFMLLSFLKRWFGIYCKRSCTCFYFVRFVLIFIGV